MSGAPLLSIGEGDGDRARQLFRVAGALRLSDGRIVIADRGSSELRIFGEGGEHLASVGGSGDGPGEYQNLWGLYRMEGDSMLGYDFQNRRMLVLAPDGTFVRSFPLVPVDAASVPAAAGVFRDGSVLVRTLPIVGARGSQLGVLRSPTVYYRVLEGAGIDRVYGEFPGSEAYVGESGGGLTARNLPFGRSSIAAAGQDRFFVGSGDAYEIEVRSRTGELLRLVRMERDPRRVTSQHEDHLHREAQEAEGTESMRQALLRQLEEIPLPERLPPYGDFVVDSEGSLWVGDYVAPGDELRVWTVFSPEGRLTSQLEMDSALRLHDIGREYILGARTDDLGIERVELYHLARNR